MSDENVIEITGDDIESLLEDDLVGYKEIHEEIVDQSRWTTTHKIVLEKIDGSLWGYFYDRGSTEYQEVETPNVIKLRRMEIVNKPSYEFVK